MRLGSGYPRIDDGFVSGKKCCCPAPNTTVDDSELCLEGSRFYSCTVSNVKKHYHFMPLSEVSATSRMV